MSNIKLIDGIAIDMKDISYIQPYESMNLKLESKDNKPYYFEGTGIFHIQLVHKEEYQNNINNFIGKISYSSKQEAEERIKQILKNQNSKEVEI